MGLLDSGSEEPKSKLLRYGITGAAFVVLLVLGVWYLLRFYPEKRAAERFMDAVVAGEIGRAHV